jgi:cell fate (sporulation/competence/biofilm development) regulator YlbF (YheA/YmcA/DUF963 family)
MNVYDEAHNLERAIKESEEFKQFRDLKKKVAENEAVKKMVDDFQAQQMELQKKQMLGEEIGEDIMANVQELHGIITQDPLALEYLQANLRFSMMMQDVFKIVGEAMEEDNAEEAPASNGQPN